MKVHIGADHAGMPLREVVVTLVEKHGYYPIVHEMPNAGPTDDYPIIACIVANQLQKDVKARGIILCGSGVGVAIAANRFKGVRAVEGYDEAQVALARAHNHVNVLTLGARITLRARISSLILAFLRTPIDRSLRHKRRIKMLDEIVYSRGYPHVIK